MKYMECGLAAAPSPGASDSHADWPCPTKACTLGGASK
eukprot:CAMPEP_0198587718 /NCGR_PEP_ID=MMETSP1462-20131121/132191_1 /TAXON_ID=1333877 /ORGANISM="Brandtodinium nutriculum, Strain RCC3387" /LENGTH=37 /DNA_ID= /DNA_START= /DNA_END= /DNA_ORIENTATION=